MISPENPYSYMSMTKASTVTENMYWVLLAPVVWQTVVTKGIEYFPMIRGLDLFSRTLAVETKTLF